MIGWEFPPFFAGGLGTATHGLAKALTKNHEVFFIMPYFSPPKTGKIDDINVFKVTYKEMSPFKVYPDYIDPILDYNYRAYLQVKELLKYHEFDIIHCHDWLSFPAGMRLHDEINIPLVVTVHSTEKDRNVGFVSQDSPITQIEMSGVHKADQVTVVGAPVKKDLCEIYKVPHEKIHIVHNGADIDRFSPDLQKISQIKSTHNLENKNSIGFVGRLTDMKGPEYFVLAAKQVLKKHPATKFLILGRGPKEKELRELVWVLGLENNIEFAGFRPKKEMIQYFYALDAWVFPSVFEPFGMVALEAMLAQKPVVITQISGIAQVVNNEEHAKVVKDRSVGEIANAIIELLDNPQKAKQMGENSRLHAQAAFSWQKLTDQIEQIYQQAINQHNHNWHIQEIATIN